MSPIYLYNGKILLRDNKIATNENCCCVLTPTPTPTVTPSPMPPGCDCLMILGNLCHCITVEIQAYDGAGVLTTFVQNGVLPAGPVGPFENLPGNFNLVAVGAVGPTFIAITANITCVVIDKKVTLTLEISAVPNGAAVYCDQALNNQMNSIQLTQELAELECDMAGFVDITGNYNLQLGLTNPNPCLGQPGGANATAQWNITNPGFFGCNAC